MKNKKTFYITTAIDYVNASPHAGHAFEKTLADALARWKRLRGYDVFFLTGVDENAQKNVQAAEKEGIPVKKFIDRNAALFLELCKKLNISYSDFIRTSAKEHTIMVKEIVKKIIDKGDIYKKVYEGLYCIGCETYYTEKDLVDGKCPEHNSKPELRKEDAYFFKLSKYKNQLLKIIPEYVIPHSRANEVLTKIKKEGLKDICVSRKGAKWGVDFPDDKNYKIWVWVDALINYISGAKGRWPADVHVIGKGINWFHSVIWPAILLSAEYKLPEKLLVHGYLNMGGKKMSKSIGNTIDPLQLLEKYDSDSVRYSLLKNSVFDDSDYSEELLISRHNNELANKLGNLVSRVTSLAEKYGVEKTDVIEKDDLEKIKEICNQVEDSKWAQLKGSIVKSKTKGDIYVGTISLDVLHKNKVKRGDMTGHIIVQGKDINQGKKYLGKLALIISKLVEKKIEDYEFDKALNEIFAFIDICNEYIQGQKIWETKNKKQIYELLDSIKAIAILLWPFIPETSEKIAKNLGFEIKFENIQKPLLVKSIKKSDILFRKIE